MGPRRLAAAPKPAVEAAPKASRLPVPEAGLPPELVHSILGSRSGAAMELFPVGRQSVFTAAATVGVDNASLARIAADRLAAEQAQAPLAPDKAAPKATAGAAAPAPDSPAAKAEAKGAEAKAGEATPLSGEAGPQGAPASVSGRLSGGPAPAPPPVAAANTPEGVKQAAAQTAGAIPQPGPAQVANPPTPAPRQPTPARRMRAPAGPPPIPMATPAYADIPDPIPEATKKIEEAAARTLPDVSLPQVTASPGGHLPNLTAKPLTKAERRAILLGEPAMDAAGLKPEEKQKINEARALMLAPPELGEDGKPVKVEPPPVEPVKVRPLPPSQLTQAEQQLFTAAVSRLLVDPAEEAKQILDGLKESSVAFPHKVLLNPDFEVQFGALGKGKLGEIEQELKKAANGMAEAMGVAGKTLDDAVANQRAAIEREKIEAGLTAEAKAELARQRAAENEAARKADAGKANAVAADAKRRAAAAKKKPKPTFRETADAAVARTKDKVSEAIARFNMMKSEREKALDEAANKQIEAYRDAVTADQLAASIAAGTGPDKDGKMPAAEADPAKAQRQREAVSKAINAAKAWLDEREKLLKTEVKRHKDQAEADTKANIAAVEEEGAAAFRALKAWGDTQDGAVETWWAGSARNLETWAAKTHETATTWAAATDKLARLQMQRDLQAVSAAVQEQLAKDEKQGEAFAKLSDDARQRFVDGILMGAEGQADTAKGLAGGMRQRVAQAQTKAVEEALQADAEAMKPEDWEAQEVLARGKNPGFNAAAKSDAIFKAGEDKLGTDEAAIYRALTGLTPLQVCAVKGHYQVTHGHSLEWALRDELSGDEERRAINLLKGDKGAAAAEAIHDALWGPGTNEAQVMEALRSLTTEEERKAAIKYYKDTYDEDLETRLAGDMSGTDLKQATDQLKGKTADADAEAIQGGLTGGIFSPDRDSVTAVYDRVRQESLAKAKAEGWTQAEFDAEVMRRNGEIEKAFGEKFKHESRYAWGAHSGQSTLQTAITAAYPFDPTNRKLVNALAANDMATADAALMQSEREGVYADDSVLKGVVRKQYDRAFESAQLDRGPELASKVDRGMKAWVASHYDKDGKLTKPFTEEERINERMKLQRESDAALQDEAFDRAKANSKMLDTVLQANHGITLDNMISQNMSWGDRRQAMSELAVMRTEIAGSTPEAIKSAKDERRLDWAYSRVRYAIEGAGTDMDELKGGLAGLNKDQLDKLDKKWRKDHDNETLRAAVQGDTSGREEDDLLDTIDHGAPQTIGDRMAELRRKHTRDEAGVGWAGRLRSENASARSHSELDRMEAKLRELRDPNLDPRKREFIEDNVERRIEHANDAIEAQRARVDAFADMLSTIASYVIGALAVIAGVLVAVFSGGTALPFIIAIGGSILGTLSGMAIKAAVKGDAYGSEEFLTDAVVGAVDLVVTIATAGTVKGGSLLSAAKAELKELGKASIKFGLKQAVQKTAQMTVKEAAETAAKGSLLKRGVSFVGANLKGLAKNQAHQFATALPTALAANLMNEDNLRRGNAFKNIAHGTFDAAVENLKVGAVMGGAGHVLQSGLGRVMQVSHPPKTPVETRAAEFKVWKEQNPNRPPREFVADFEARQAAASADAALAHAETRAARKALMENMPPAEHAGFADVPIVRLGDAEFRALNKGPGDAMLFKKDGQVAIVIREGGSPAAVRDLTAQVRETVAPGTSGRTVNPAEALPPRLQNRVPVDVINHPDLGPDGVRVVPMDPDGKIRGVRLEVGPNATAQQIHEHVKTIEAARKFVGLTGEIRQTAIDVVNAMGADVISPRQRGRWEAALEVQKLRGMVDNRLQQMREHGISPRRVNELLREIGSYQRQLDTHLQRLTLGAAAESRGYIAAEATKRSKKSGKRKTTDEPAGPKAEPQRIVEPRRPNGEQSAEVLAQRARQVEILEQFAKLDHAEAVARQAQGDEYLNVSASNKAIDARLDSTKKALTSLKNNRATPPEVKALIGNLGLDSSVHEVRAAMGRIADAGALPDLSARLNKTQARQLEGMHELLAKERQLNQRLQALADSIALIETQRQQLRTEYSTLKGGVFDHVGLTQLGDPHAILCLARGTPVWTTHAARAIEALAPGAVLAGLDAPAGAVERLIEGHAFAAVDIAFADGSNLTATRSHPIRVLDPPRWLPARLLHPGLRVATRSGPLAVARAITSVRTLQTCNLEVAPGHCYLAGAAGVLVHNGSVDDRPSNWASKDRRNAMIYAVVEKARPDVIIYIGKTCQPTIESRFDQHLQNKGKIEKGWTRDTHEIRLVDFGHWTDYEIAVWEEKYIRDFGGIAGEGKTTNLVNDIHAITDAAIREYGDPKYGHNPCR